MIRIFKKNIASRTGTLQIVILLVCLYWVAPVASNGWDGRFEQLQFRISWWLIPGAEAVMQAVPEADVLFQMQACTNPALDLFHKVRDSIMVRASRTKEGFQSIYYQENIQEGRYRNRISVAFDKAGMATVKDHDSGEFQSLALPPGTLDLITAFYYTRERDLEVGDRFEIPVIDNHKPYRLSIEVLGKEIRKTYFGKRTPTIVIRPLLQAEGVFKRDGAMRIWLTDDARHLPVHVETKVSIGSIYADLIGISYNPANLIDELPYCRER